VKLVGLDPSLTSFGSAVVHPGEARSDDGVMLTPLVRTYRTKVPATGHARLAVLLHQVRLVCDGADVVVIEDFLVRRVPGNAVGPLAGLHWLVRHELWQAGVPYVPVNTMQRAKWLTGKGNAGKDDCLAAAIKRFPMADLHGNDEADALTLAAMGAAHYGYPVVRMPASADEVLAKITWPAVRGDSSG
jgi:crossover junction endodeoxyribonuclease RuvC